MKICVTGGCGFIGLNLVKKLKELNYEVIVVDDYNCFHRLIQNNSELIEIHDYKQICESRNFDFLKNIDFVFHLGANSSTRATYDELLIPNVKFSVLLIDMCEKLKIPLVFASSGSVLPTPLTEYANSKKFIEDYIQEKLNNHKGDFVYLRYFNVYGNNESHKNEMASIVTKWIDNHKKGIQLNYLFNGSDKIKRDFIHVDDINNANLLMLHYFIKNNHLPFTFFGRKVFEIGTGNPVSFQKLAEEIIKHTKGTIKYIANPYSKEDYQFFTKAYIKDISELYEMTYLKPYKPMTINKGIKLVFKAIMNQQ